MRDDQTYLQHTAESIELVEGYLAGPDGELSDALFHTDLRTQDAVLPHITQNVRTLPDLAAW